VFFFSKHAVYCSLETQKHWQSLTLLAYSAQVLLVVSICFTGYSALVQQSGTVLWKNKNKFLNSLPYIKKLQVKLRNGLEKHVWELLF